MDRLSVRQQIAIALVLAVAALPLIGCQSAMVTAMYLIKGNVVDPEFAELKGKKVAVVCRPMVALQYRNSSVARDLAQQVSSLLEKNVPKIHMVDQRKVNKWSDENTWEEYRDVGKALKADMVVGIDLESFTIFQGQTLYQGKANAAVAVYDCQKNGKKVFEKTLPQSVYPPNAGVPTSERLEGDFRREFVAVLADQVARHFYEHDPYPDMAQDSDALK
jgi:ABC-type uncharacterized transport system auxiliary subunit